MSKPEKRITVRERATSIAWKLHLLREEAKRYAARVAALAGNAVADADDSQLVQAAFDMVAEVQRFARNGAA